MALGDRTTLKDRLSSFRDNRELERQEGGETRKEWRSRLHDSDLPLYSMPKTAPREGEPQEKSLVDRAGDDLSDDMERPKGVPYLGYTEDGEGSRQLGIQRVGGEGTEVDKNGKAFASLRNATPLTDDDEGGEDPMSDFTGAGAPERTKPDAFDISKADAWKGSGNYSYEYVPGEGGKLGVINVKGPKGEFQVSDPGSSAMAAILTERDMQLKGQGADFDYNKFMTPRGLMDSPSSPELGAVRAAMAEKAQDAAQAEVEKLGAQVSSDEPGTSAQSPYEGTSEQPEEPSGAPVGEEAPGASALDKAKDFGRITGAAAMGSPGMGIVPATVAALSTEVAFDPELRQDVLEAGPDLASLLSDYFGMPGVSETGQNVVKNVQEQGLEKGLKQSRTDFWASLFE